MLTIAALAALAAPIQTPAGAVELDGTRLIVRHAEVVYIDPPADTLAGWPILPAGGVVVPEGTEAAFRVQPGRTYTVRALAHPADRAAPARDEWTETVAVPEPTRAEAIAAAVTAYLAAYRDLLALEPTQAEIMDALRGGE